MGDPAPRRATYADVLAAPAHMVAEVVDGVLHLSPRPGKPHAAAATALGEELGPPFKRGRGGPGGWIIQLQRRGDGKARPEPPEVTAVRDQVGVIDRQWGYVKKAAKGSKTAAPWVAAGDTVVALIHTHVDGAIAAMTANDATLVRQFAAVLETDLIAYQFASWHAFAYQNVDRIRGWSKGLVESFDADDRKFTGRDVAEDGARQLERLAAAIDKDSAKHLALLTTNVSYRLSDAQGGSIAIKLTSAAGAKQRAEMTTEIDEIRKLEEATELVVAGLNGFLATARQEGFNQAIDAVEEFYKVKGFLDAAKSSGKQDKQDKPKEDKGKQPSTRPDVEPLPPIAYPPEEGDGGRWGCDDVRCNVYPVQEGATCPDRVIGSSRGHPTEAAACLAAQRNANAQVPRGCNKRHCNCNGKCRKM